MLWLNIAKPAGAGSHHPHNTNLWQEHNCRCTARWFVLTCFACLKTMVTIMFAIFCKTSIVSFRRNGKLGVYFGTLKLELVGLVDNAWQTEQLWVVNQVFGFRQMLVKWWIFVLAALPVLLNKSSLSQSNYLGEFNTKLNFSMSFAVICWNEVKSFKAKTLHNFRHKNF